MCVCCQTSDEFVPWTTHEMSSGKNSDLFYYGKEDDMRCLPLNSYLYTHWILDFK